MAERERTSGSVGRMLDDNGIAIRPNAGKLTFVVVMIHRGGEARVDVIVRRAMSCHAVSWRGTVRCWVARFGRIRFVTAAFSKTNPRKSDGPGGRLPSPKNAARIQNPLVRALLLVVSFV